MLAQFFKKKKSRFGSSHLVYGPEPTYHPCPFEGLVAVFLERGDRADKEEGTDRRGPGERSPGSSRLRTGPASPCSQPLPPTISCEPLQSSLGSQESVFIRSRES